MSSRGLKWKLVCGAVAVGTGVLGIYLWNAGRNLGVDATGGAGESGVALRFPPQSIESKPVVRDAESGVGAASQDQAVAPLASPLASVEEDSSVYSLEPRVDLTSGMLPWEATMKHIMKTPLPPGAKAQALFAIVPRVPEEAMQTATEQATAWLRDGDYATTATPLITNPATNGVILMALFADLMERPDAIALPNLLAIARNPTHPLAGPARDNLELLLGQNHGWEWRAWEAAVQKRLEEGRR